MPLLNHRLSRRFFVKGASAAAAAGALTLQAQAAQADEAPANLAPATEETKARASLFSVPPSLKPV